MPTTIETTVYQYDELSEAAKAKARDWFRGAGADGYTSWAECTIEDAANAANALGLDIRQTRRVKRDNSIHYDPTIYWSGFWSQGDGACFEGVYSYKKGAAVSIREYAPEDKELHRIADELQKLQKRHFYKLVASCKQSGHYMHSGCMRVTVEHGEDIYRDVSDVEDGLTQCLRDFADWIYKCLGAEYEYQNSDEAVTENIRANEYRFTADGRIF